jgi:Fur family peroxide stress response transcriptional regulator
MISAREIQLRVDRFTAHCRAMRLAATPQRLAIFRELAGSCEHPSAEFIHQRVRTRIPSISLDTVYRTLRCFEDQGLIERVGSDGERARFDADTAPHPHFVCKVCGWVGDIPDRSNYTPPTTDRNAPYGVIHSIHLEFRGICTKCAQSVQQPVDGC